MNTVEFSISTMPLKDKNFTLVAQIGCQGISFVVSKLFSPIEEPEHINSILRDLEYIISDNEGASLLKKDGSYSKVKPSSRTKIKISSQSSLIEDSKSRVNELKTVKFSDFL